MIKMIKNQGRYFTNAVSEPTNRANQTLACRRTSLDNRYTGNGEKIQKDEFCGHVGNAMDKRGNGMVTRTKGLEGE